MTGPRRVTVTSCSTVGPPRTRDGLAADLCLLPLALELVGAWVVLSEALDVEVLVVRRGVRDAPGHESVVAKVREARASRKGEARHVEFAAGDVVLVVDVGRVQRAMGVTGQERFARGRPVPASAQLLLPESRTSIQLTAWETLCSSCRASAAGLRRRRPAAR